MEALETELVTGPPCCLRVRGEIDMATAPHLAVALQRALAADPTVAVDMADVTFIDAAGLRVILHAAGGSTNERPLVLINAPLVARLLELVGLSELATIDVRVEAGVHG